MNRRGLYLSASDLDFERRQCLQEGRDIAPLECEFARVLSLDLEQEKNQAAAEALLDGTRALPLRPDRPFQEPSDLEGIRAARPPAGPGQRSPVPRCETLLDRLHGAWTGRAVGCLLGKPTEGWSSGQIASCLKEHGRWPLDDFFRWSMLSPAWRARWDMDGRWAWKARHMADRIGPAMPVDDDMNYTVIALGILAQYGPDFTPDDVVDFWLARLPLMQTFTAERVAYRNVIRRIDPPESARFRNPYREWIGAQIRADVWGYANPGDPERAAEMAWRDACISHTKNGIYGAMWVAAMLAQAFTTGDIPSIIQAGLAQIPARCRLATALREALEWRAAGVPYDEATARIHGAWDEEMKHDWCHAIPNALVVAVALLWGEGDYARTICRAVQPGYDTDCNGATAGSLIGLVLGRQALPSAWTDGIHDTLHTGVAGYHHVTLTDMARRTGELVRALRG